MFPSIRTPVYWVPGLPAGKSPIFGGEDVARLAAIAAVQAGLATGRIVMRSETNGHFYRGQVIIGGGIEWQLLEGAGREQAQMELDLLRGYTSERHVALLRLDELALEHGRQYSVARDDALGRSRYRLENSELDNSTLIELIAIFDSATKGGLE